MKIGVARVSTHDQRPESQEDALRAAGCEKVLTDKASGKLARRPGLDKALLIVRDNGGVGYWNYLNSGPARLGACIALVATWLVDKPTRTAGRAQRARGAEAARQQAVALQAIQPSP